MRQSEDKKRRDLFCILSARGYPPEEAIRQIKEKKYVLRFRGRPGERERYIGRVLAVGIGYDRKQKKHACKVEVLRERI